MMATTMAELSTPSFIATIDFVEMCRRGCEARDTIGRGTEEKEVSMSIDAHACTHARTHARTRVKRLRTRIIASE
jgi:hypothetical protein